MWVQLGIKRRGCSLKLILIRRDCQEGDGIPSSCLGSWPCWHVLSTSLSLPRFTGRQPFINFLMEPTLELTSRDRKLINVSFWRSTCGIQNKEGKKKKTHRSPISHWNHSSHVRNMAKTHFIIASKKTTKYQRLWPLPNRFRNAFDTKWPNPTLYHQIIQIPISQHPHPAWQDFMSLSQEGPPWFIIAKWPLCSSLTDRQQQRLMGQVTAINVITLVVFQYYSNLLSCTDGILTPKGQRNVIGIHRKMVNRQARVIYLEKHYIYIINFFKKWIYSSHLFPLGRPVCCLRFIIL